MLSAFAQSFECFASLPLVARVANGAHRPPNRPCKTALFQMASKAPAASETQHLFDHRTHKRGFLPSHGQSHAKASVGFPCCQHNSTSRQARHSQPFEYQQQCRWCSGVQAMHG